MRIYQGDIQFRLVDEIPPECIEKDKIVAYGEVTGHMHQVVGNAKVMADKNGRQFIISNGCEVVHEEHGKVTIPKGIFAVRMQREADIVEGTRQVLD